MNLPPDTQLAIRLREKELEKWQLKEAEHWNEYLHAHATFTDLNAKLTD